MEVNPYQAPGIVEERSAVEIATRWLRFPALGLLVTASLGCLWFGGIALLFLFAPLVAPMGYEEYLTNVLGQGGLLAFNLIALWGAIRMRQLRNYRLCVTAAVLASIPFSSPAIVLGIPFGLWALVILNMPEAKRAFGS